MSSVSSTGNSYSIPVSSTSALSTVSLSDVASQSLTNASANLITLQNDMSLVSARSSAYATLATALQTFFGQIKPFQDQTQVAGLTVSSSSNAIATTIGRQSVAGTYTVSVNQLSQAQTSKTNNSTSATAAALYGAGTLSIKVGSGSATAINVTNTMSPTDLANAINAAKAGVTASVAGSGTAYYVSVTGNATGAANAITFSETGTASTGLASSANVTQAAQDANFTVNGKTYTSPTNTTTNGVPGVVMTFSGTVANATVTVGANASTVATSLTSFITDYNTVIAAINTARSSDGLTADPSLNGLMVKLSRIMGNVSTGASGTFRSLSDVGITRNSDGTYNINNNTLTASTVTNAASVANLLTGTALGTTGLASSLRSVITSWGEPGVGTLGKVGYTLARRSLKMSRRQTEDMGILTTLTEGLTGTYTNLQVALSRYAAQSMVVSALTAQTGISTDSYDLTKTR